MSKTKTLLPSGFRDLLPSEALKEESAIRAVLDLCRSYGYVRVRPPLAEFEEALFAEGPGAFIKEQAFRFVDSVSQKMMALRFDITTQIARIVSSRLADEPRPLRVMYANDVLRAKASQQRLDRQFCQVGCELISDENADADLEITVLALQSLAKIGVQGVTIDLSYTKLLHLILSAYGIEGAEKGQWLDMLASKDMAALEARPESFSRALAAVVSAYGQPVQTLDALRQLDLDAQGIACVDQLQNLYEGLSVALSDLSLQDIQITMDPFETKGFEYHSGICFTLFAQEATAEIGRGGRYDIQGGQSASGFTLYMDMVMKIAPEAKQGKTIVVPNNISWKEISDLQADGWIVLRDIDGYDNAARATHVYDDGKVKAA